MRIRVGEQEIFVGRFITVEKECPDGAPVQGRGEASATGSEAMGGDNAPGETCAGDNHGSEEFPDLEIALVGDSRSSYSTGGIRRPYQEKAHLVHAEERIPWMHPAVAVKKKRRSSLDRRRWSAQVSPRLRFGGSTGAIVAAGVLVVGRIPGLKDRGLETLPAVDRYRC